MFKKTFIAILTAIFATITFAGCSTTPSQQSTPSVEIASYEAIIDVRTPAEWDEGHLEGATLITLESPSFAEQISKLDKTANYYVYCRSGNRSEQAIRIMKDNGFTGNLKNGGAVADASQETGLPVVK